MLIGIWEAGFPEKSDVTAALYDNGDFILSGSGDVIRTLVPEQRPWHELRGLIRRVSFGSDVRPMSIASWFWGCDNLVEVDRLPDGLKDMSASFCNCSSLKSLPDIPASVTDLDEAFIRCRSLREFPVIPGNVIYTCDTFVECNALSGRIRLDASLEQYNFMFQDACSDEGAELIIDYAPGLEDLADAIICTATDISNIHKGQCITAA